VLSRQGNYSPTPFGVEDILRRGGPGVDNGTRLACRLVDGSNRDLARNVVVALLGTSHDFYCQKLASIARGGPPVAARRL
jgi:hypothetical protein